MRFHLFFLLTVCSVAACGEAADSSSPKLDIRQSSLEQFRTGLEVLYTRVEVLDDRDSRTLVSESGELTLSDWEQAAAGVSSTGETDDWLYTEDSYWEQTPLGAQHTYTVGRTPTHAGTSLARVPRRRPPNAGLLARGDEEVLLTISLAVSELVKPPSPPVELFGADVRATAERQRRSLQSAHEQAVAQASAPVLALLQDSQSTILDLSPHFGQITALVKSQEIGRLASLPSVAFVEEVVSAEDDCNPSCTMTNANAWKIGDSKAASRLDAQRFLDAGYTGERANTVRHSFHDITVAIMENADNFEDEGCHFGDLNSCTGSQRIHGRYDCTGGSCSSVSTFLDNDPGSDHGTQVASIVLGDLDDGQADSLSFGDSCWDGVSHCEDWQDAATGMAPEAGALLYWLNGSSAAGYAHVAPLLPDIANMSHSFASGACSIESGTTEENNRESMFDNGILVVASPGNLGVSTCNVRADTPKVFAVNSLDADGGTCFSNYQSCALETSNSARGGASVSINGSVWTNAVSAIDLVAPTDVLYAGDSTGSFGTVRETAIVSGVSFAVPHVAGAAALVKDWMLALGNTWVNSPGRLHTVMLAMGDRWNGSSQSLSGASNTWGLGRLKLRLLKSGEGMDPWSWRMSTFNIGYSSTDFSYLYSTTPLPVHTDLVKCVLMEDEDMSSKSGVSHIYLRARVRNPVSGSCSLAGSITRTRSDASYDLKHMVAFEDLETNLDGMCIEIEVNVEHVEAPEQIHVFCYASGRTDDEPN